jgi:hypothetical protein
VLNARASLRRTGRTGSSGSNPARPLYPEPVYQGELVTFNMVVERTTLGQPCRLTRTVPMYVDDDAHSSARTRP